MWFVAQADVFELDKNVDMWCFSVTDPLTKFVKKEAKLKTHWMLGNLPNDFIGDKNIYSCRAMCLSLKSVCC